MKSNPVVSCNFIIRSQLEYSAASQTVVVRCILETAATGERRGFTDVDALLDAVRVALMEMHNKIIPIE